MKICKKCNLSKDENQFYFQGSGKTKRRATCISCNKNYSHSDDTLERRRKHWEENKDELNAARRTDKYRIRNRELQKARRVKINAQQRARRQSDPVFRIRKYLSSKITRALKNAGGKKYMSFLKYVPYTMLELKEHLEKKFEPWMNWNNQGSYKVNEWDDKNFATWKWQIDHIIPSSDLPYQNMSDNNFKICWAISNLRPLSAKQNLKDGAQKTRHSQHT